ncbi:MAG: hypothetical protein JJ866_05995 [Roseibium sp.]|uniref:hypothetical protein n=1 Tax=Roseibium sp. TaxID=1936156 RepID=UPI001AFEFF6D|nr:hypothetical protein [Roseibium sp.]MBO6891475.1 hypothetical protein [Roseibium sp.]MBO6931335.1 hypothetical protein [Roseibium sp.]
MSGCPEEHKAELAGGGSELGAGKTTALLSDSIAKSAICQLKESRGLQDSARISGLNLHFTICPNFNLNKLRSQNNAAGFSRDHISLRFLQLMDAILPSNGQISNHIVNFYRVETDPAVSVSSICRTNRTTVSGQ